MTTSPALEEQIGRSGISYSRKHDAAYRSGMVLQALGAAVLAVLYPLESPFYSAGIMLFELGVLLSGMFLLVWISWIKKLLLGSILIGIPLQLFGLLAAPPEHAIPFIFAGIGFVCVGAAGIVGKEAYCFGYREGWALMWLYPLLVIITIVGHEQRIVHSLAFSCHFLLYLSLVGKKLRQPLLASCASNACGTPGQGKE